MFGAEGWQGMVGAEECERRERRGRASCGWERRQTRRGVGGPTAADCEFGAAPLPPATPCCEARARARARRAGVPTPGAGRSGAMQRRRDDQDDGEKRVDDSWASSKMASVEGLRSQGLLGRGLWTGPEWAIPLVLSLCNAGVGGWVWVQV